MKNSINLGIFDSKLSDENKERQDLESHINKEAENNITVKCYNRIFCSIKDKEFHIIFVHSGDYSALPLAKENLIADCSTKRHLYWVSTASLPILDSNKKKINKCEERNVNAQLRSKDDYIKLNWKKALQKLSGKIRVWENNGKVGCIPKFSINTLTNKNEKTASLNKALSCIEKIDNCIQYWLSIWDWQNNLDWQKVKQKLNSLQDFNQRKNAWEKTRPDRLFKTEDMADFWFGACKTKIKEIYFDLFPVPEKDKEKQSLLSDVLFWGYPAKPKWRFADCKPFLHNRDSLNDALVVAKNLNKEKWCPPSLSSLYNGGGCLRLLFEAIYWELDQNKAEEKFNRRTDSNYQEELLNLNKETIKFFICKAGEIQCDENKNQDMAALFEGKNTKYEDMRKRIEWLFKTARNEYLTILETIEFKKKIKEFENKRDSLNHTVLEKHPLIYLWEDRTDKDENINQDNIQKVLEKWKNKIRPDIFSMNDGSLCKEIDRSLPKEVKCTTGILDFLGIPDSMHELFLNANKDNITISIDVDSLIKQIDSFADLPPGDMPADKAELNRLSTAVIKLKLWLHAFSGIENLLKYINKIDGIKIYPKELINA